MSTISKTFKEWMKAVDVRQSPFIYWPDRESLIQTMPQSFQFSLGNKTTVITGCFEHFIEKPTNLLALAKTFSLYKHYNTVEILVGITSQGSISFVS